MYWFGTRNRDSRRAGLRTVDPGLDQHNISGKAIKEGVELELHRFFRILPEHLKLLPLFLQTESLPVPSVH